MILYSLNKLSESFLKDGFSRLVFSVYGAAKTSSEPWIAPWVLRGFSDAQLFSDLHFNIPTQVIKSTVLAYGGTALYTYRKKKVKPTKKKKMQTARAMLKLYNSAEQSGNLPAWRLVGDHYSLYTLHTQWVAHADYECTAEPLVQALLKDRGHYSPNALFFFFLQGSQSTIIIMIQRLQYLEGKCAFAVCFFVMLNDQVKNVYCSGLPAVYALG